MDYQLYIYGAITKDKLFPKCGSDGSGRLDKRLSLHNQHIEVQRIARQRHADGYQLLTRNSDKTIHSMEFAYPVH